MMAFLTLLGRVAVVTTGLLLSKGADEGASGGAEGAAAAGAYAAELAYLDANQDGSIDAQEFARGQQGAAMLLMLSWEACDQDSSGEIDRAEFMAAAPEAMAESLAANDETEQQAEEALANAIPLNLLLEQLGKDESYAEELAALRQAVQDMDDEESVVTHVVASPTRYPRLSPVVRVWTRYYPVKPALRRHVKGRYRPLGLRAKPPRPAVKPRGKLGPGKPAAPRPPKPRGKPGPRPPRGGGRR
ncbi:MAG: hypothetical protein JSV19_07665 [Phycisphaerales bacterium]|nr:MAG: hypothetical protein JSV19_07665 [Phycisphaerales bacterium]